MKGCTFLSNGSIEFAIFLLLLLICLKTELLLEPIKCVKIQQTTTFVNQKKEKKILLSNRRIEIGDLIKKYHVFLQIV